jgi:GAF domain-containing protein
MSAEDKTRPSAPGASSHPLGPTEADHREEAAERDIVTRYSGLYAPVDGVYQQIARMAAQVFDAPVVTVTIGDDPRVWFPATEGPRDGGRLPAGPGLSSRLGRPTAVTVVLDAAGDPRTSDHPWVRTTDGVRFFVTAPVTAPNGQVIGTLDVMDRKRRRRVDDGDVDLLEGLAATIAQLLNLRVGALAALKAAGDEHATELTRRDSIDRAAVHRAHHGEAARDREQPRWCQLGGARTCERTADTKVADSWGDSAWGCWYHAEEALIQIPSVFLASPADPGLDTYRHRTTYADDSR